MRSLLKNRLQRELAILGRFSAVTKRLPRLFGADRAQFDTWTTPPKSAGHTLNSKQNPPTAPGCGGLKTKRVGNGGQRPNQAILTAIKASKKINTAPTRGNTMGIIGVMLSTTSTSPVGAGVEVCADMLFLSNLLE
jgi:hypothetical protein